MRIWTHFSSGLPCKLTAWITLSAFLLTTIGQPAAQAFSLTPPQKSSPFSLISPDRGAITESLCFGSDTAVILIQDLHCHPGVQKNIAALLKGLDHSSGLERIFVEGNIGPVDNSWITLFPENKRKDIIETLILSGKLTGAEYFSLTGTRADPLLGLEDASLFKPNIARMADILRRRRDAQASLENARQTIAAIKTRWYSAANKRIDRLVNKYEKGKINDRKFGRAITALARKSAVDMFRYGNLKANTELSKNSTAFSTRKISGELNSYLGSLKNRLPYREWRALQEKTENFSDTGSLFAFLSRLPANDPLFCLPAYSRLAGYLKSFNISQSLNPIALISEQRGMIHELRRAFSSTTTEKEIAFLDDYLHCLAGYTGAEVTYSDYIFIQENRHMFEFLWGKYADPADIASAKAWLPKLDEFYRVNVARNDSFLAAIGPAYLAGCNDEVSGTPSEWIPAAKHRIAVVTGGFHTEELARILTERKISFAVITPQVPASKWDARERFEQILLKNTERMSQATITETYAQALPQLNRLKTVEIDLREAEQLENTGQISSQDGTGADKRASPASHLRNLGVTLFYSLIPFVLMTLFLHFSGFNQAGDLLPGFPAFAFLLTTQDTPPSTIAAQKIDASITDTTLIDLTKHLSDGNEEKRAEAAFQLATLHEEYPETKIRALNLLYPLLNDSSRAVRLATIASLQKIGDPAYANEISAINDLFSPKENTRKNAIDTLFAIGDRLALVSLRDMMNNDPRHNLRRKAAFVIAEIEHNKKLSTVLKRLEIVVALNQKFTDSVEEATIKTLIEEVATTPLAVPILINLTGLNNVTIVTAACQALAAKIESPEVRAALENALNDDDNDLLYSDTGSLQIKGLLDDYKEEHQIKPSRLSAAVEQSDELLTSEPVPAEVSAYHKNPIAAIRANPAITEAVREESGNELPAFTGIRNAVEYLLPLFANASLKHVVSIADAFWILGDHSGFIKYARQLSSPNKLIRQKAVREMGEFGIKKSLPILRTVIREDCSLIVRAEAAVTIASIENNVKFVAYASSIMDEHVDEKKRIRAIRSLTDPLAAEILVYALLDYVTMDAAADQLKKLASGDAEHSKEFKESLFRALESVEDVELATPVEEILTQTGLKNEKTKTKYLSLWLIFAAAAIVARIALGGPAVFDLSALLPDCVNIGIGFALFLGKTINFQPDRVDVSLLLNTLKNEMSYSFDGSKKERQRNNISELVKAIGNGQLTDDSERADAIKVFHDASSNVDPVTAQQALFMLRLLESGNNNYLSKCSVDLKNTDPEIVKRALIDLGLSGSMTISTLIDNANLRRHPLLEVRVYAWGAELMVQGKSHEMEMAINLLLGNNESKASVLNRGTAATELSEDIRELKGLAIRKQTIEVLIYCLMDRDPGTRKAAFTALKMIAHDNNYIKVILQNALDEKDPKVRGAALLAVQALDRRDLLPEVRKALTRKYDWNIWEENNVTAAACRCVGELDDTESLPVLQQLISGSPQNVRGEAIEAISKMARQLKPKTLPTTEAALKSAFQDTKHYGVWGRAAQALVRLQGTAKAGPLVALLAQLCEDNDETRQETLKRLGELRDEKVLPYLISFLNNRSPYVRALTIRAIEKHAKSDLSAVTAAFKNILENDKSAYPRATAAYALGIIGDPTLTPYLRVYLNDPDLTVQVNTMRALGKLKDQESLDRMTPYLEHDDWHARNGAAQALNMLQDERAFLPIADRLSREDNAICRKTMTRALVEIDPVQSFPILAGMLDDMEHSLRVFDDVDYTGRVMLVKAIGETRAPGAIPVLEPILTGGHKIMRKAAAEALGTIGTPEAISLLLLRAKKESDPAVQGKITAMLKQLGVPSSQWQKKPAPDKYTSLLHQEIRLLQTRDIPHLLAGASTAEAVLKIMHTFFPSARFSALSRIAPALKDARFAITSPSEDKSTEQQAKDMASLGVDTVYYTRLPAGYDKDSLEKLTNDSNTALRDMCSVTVPGEEVCLNVFTQIRDTANGKSYRVIFYEPLDGSSLGVTARYAAAPAIAAWLMNERPEICERLSMDLNMDILTLSGLSDLKLSVLNTTSIREQFHSPFQLVLDRSSDSREPSKSHTSMLLPEIRRLFDFVIEIPHCARMVIILDHMLKGQHRQTYRETEPLFSTTIDLKSFQGGVGRLSDERFINMLTDLRVDTIVLRSWQGIPEQELAAALRALHHGKKIRVVLEYPLNNNMHDSIPDTIKSIPSLLTMHDRKGAQSFDGFIVDFDAVNFALLPLDDVHGIMKSLKSAHDTVLDTNSRALLGIHYSQEQLVNKPFTVPRQHYLFEKLSYRNVVRFFPDEEITPQMPGAWVEMTTLKTTPGGTRSKKPHFKNVKDFAAALRKLFNDRSAGMVGLDYNLLEMGWKMNGEGMDGALFDFKNFIESHVTRTLSTLVRATERTFDGGYEDSFENEKQVSPPDKETRKIIRAFLEAYYRPGEKDEGHDYEDCKDLLNLPLFEAISANSPFSSMPAEKAEPKEYKEYMDYFAGFLRGTLEQYLTRNFLKADRPFLNPSHQKLFGSLLADQYLEMEGYLGGDRIEELIHHIAQLDDDAALESEVSSIPDKTDVEEDIDEHTEGDRLIAAMKSLDARLTKGNARLGDVYPDIEKVIRDMAALIRRHQSGSMPRSTAFLLQFMLLYAHRDEKGLYNFIKNAGVQLIPEVTKQLLSAA